MEEMAKKRVKDSETEQSYLLMHRHINGYGPVSYTHLRAHET